MTEIKEAKKASKSVASDTRPNFTPNEIKGYRIRPDRYNWTVVQVKVKGEDSKDAGQEVMTPMNFFKNLHSAVEYIFRTAGATEGRRYQDESFLSTGIVADLNSLTTGFRISSGLAIDALKELESYIRIAGVQLKNAGELTEDKKVAVLGLRGEINDVREQFNDKARVLMASIAGLATRVADFGLNLPEDKKNDLRLAATSDEWKNLELDYRQAFREAILVLDDLNTRIGELGLSSTEFRLHLLKLQGGSIDEGNDDNDASDE